MTDNPFGDQHPRRVSFTRSIRGTSGRTKKPFPLARVLLGASAVLFLFCSGGLGLILWATGSFGPKWQPFEPPGVGARVEMPYPAGMSAASGDRGAQGVTVHEGIRLFPRQEFALVTTMNGAGPDSALDWIQAILRPEYPNITQTSRTVTATPHGLRAVDAVFDLGNGEHMVCRAVGAGRTVYLVTALGSGFAAKTPEVQRFLNSLTITDPDRLAAAKSETEAERIKNLTIDPAEAKARKDRDVAELQERVARESAERAAAARKTRRQIEAYHAITYTGKPLPDPSQGKDVRAYLSFDADVLATFRSPGIHAVEGVRNNALWLPTLQSVATTEPEGMRFEPRDPLTIAGWFKAFEPAGDVILVRSGPNDKDADLFSLTLDSTTIRAKFWNPGTTDGGRKIDAPGPLSADWKADQNWHHFAFTREPTNRGEVIAFYLDGRLAIRQDRPYLTDWSRARLVSFGSPREKAVLDGRPVKYIGAVDEVVFVARAYTPAQVRELGAFPSQ